MPTVSVCIPTYNRCEYLRETLASIQAQGYKDYEIVVVDDGSTDDTAAMIKELAFPVRYYYQANAGDAAARNKLIELAAGRYITFIDSDDLLMPDALERMAAVLDREREDVIVYGPYYGIDARGKIISRCKRKLYSGHVTARLFQDIFIHSGGSMFPRRIFADEPAFDTSLRVCSDYDMWLRLSLKYRFVALEEPTFKRRRHGGNLSQASSANRLAELQVLERFYEERGGKRAVPEKIARKRLAQEEYRVGRSAFREGDKRLARKYFAKALRRRPRLKVFFSWLISMG